MKIAVIGAGIVGISSANWLQKYGQDVTLFDMNRLISHQNLKSVYYYLFEL